MAIFVIFSLKDFKANFWANACNNDSRKNNIFIMNVIVTWILC